MAIIWTPGDFHPIPPVAMRTYMSISMKCVCVCVCVYMHMDTCGFHEYVSTYEQCIWVHMVYFQPRVCKGTCIYV